LSLALLLVGVILWTVADLVSPQKVKAPSPKLRSLSWVVLGLISVQIVLGAYVAGLKSGFSYNTWPLMQGEIFPSSLIGSLNFSEIFDNGVAVQFIHRWFAFIALAGIALLWHKGRQAQLLAGTGSILHLLMLT